MTFRFLGQAPTRTALALLLIGWLAMGALGLWRGGGTRPLSFAIFMAVALLSIGLLAAAVLRSQADVVIDARTISRQSFGFRWQSMAWDDIAEIRVFRLRDAEAGKAVRVFTLLARPGAAGSTSSARLSFRERFEGLDRLIAEVDAQARRRHVPMSIEVEGVRQPLEHL